MDIVFDDGAVLVRAIVVGRDAPRTVVDPLTHSGISKVGQMIGLGSACHRRIFNFYKIADVDFSRQLGAGAQPRKRPNQRTFTHVNARLLAIDVGKWMDHGTVRNDGVGHKAICAASLSK